MALSIKVALIIKGNINTDGGMQPLVSYGVFPNEEMDTLDIAPSISEGISFKIKHCEKYIIYKLIDIKVRPKDSNRDGRFVLALAIPRTLQLANGKSPYKLMTDIYTKFVNENMMATGDGYHKFEKSDIDRDPYIELLSQYPTEERSSRMYIPMSQSGETGIVQASSEEKLELLFRDSQYPEFRQFHEIEIGRTCQPTVNIDIPRNREYRIELNYMDIKKRLIKESDSFNSADYLHDDEYNTYSKQHISFTLQDVLTGNAASMFGNRVIIEGDTIKCTVKSDPKEFEFKAEIKPSFGSTLSVEDKEYVGKLLKKGTLHIMFGGEDISNAFLTGDSFIIFGPDIKQQVFPTIEAIEDYRFSVEKRKDQKKIFLTVKNTRKPEPKQERFPERILDKNGNKKNPERNNFPIPMTVSGGLKLHFVSFRNLEEEYIANVTSPNEKDKWLVRQALSFKPSIVNGGSYSYHAFLMLDDAWQTVNSNDIRVVLEYRNKYEKIRLSEPLTPEFKDCVAEITLGGISYHDKERKIPKYYFLIAGIIIGLVLGIATTFFMPKGEEKNMKSDDLKELSDEVEELRRENNQLKEKVEFLQNHSTPVPLDQQSVEKVEYTKSAVETGETTPPPPPPDYKAKIVENFNNHNFDALNGSKGLLSKAVKARQITSDQSRKISSLWWNPNDKQGKYTAAQKAKIDAALRNKVFQTVEQIVAVSNELKLN